MGGEGDWSAGKTRRHSLHRHTAEDAQREDYAASSSGVGDQRQRQGRHHYTGGLWSDREVAGARRGLEESSASIAPNPPLLAHWAAAYAWAFVSIESGASGSCPF